MAYRRLSGSPGRSPAAATSLRCASARSALPRRLEAPGLDALLGAGVFYGATTSEAAAFAGEHVFIAGGANSAGQAAVNLARYAKQVTIVVRGDSLAARMSQYLIDEITATANIDVRTATQIAGAEGTDRPARSSASPPRSANAPSPPPRCISTCTNKRGILDCHWRHSKVRCVYGVSRYPARSIPGLPHLLPREVLSRAWWMDRCTSKSWYGGPSTW
jgi:Pyridine nucleotide-disulphide oxidoreductase